MRAVLARRSLLPVFTLSGLLALLVAPTAAADAAALARDADKLVRSAERLMFSGKKEAADAELVEALAMIEELKAAAPDHAKLKTLLPKYAKVRKDLDKRLGKAGGASGGATTPAPPPQPAAKPSSGGARDYRLPMAEKAVKAVSRDAESLVLAIEEIFSEDPATMAMPNPVEKMVEQSQARIDRVTQGVTKVESQYGDVAGLPTADLEAAKATAVSAQARLAELAAARRASDAASAASAAAGAQAQAAQQGSAASDVELIARLHEATRDRMEGIHGRNIVVATRLGVEDVEEGRDHLARAETVVVDLEPHLGRLAETYGTKAMEINNAFFKRMGRDAPSRAGNQLEELVDAVRLVRESRVATGEYLANHCEMMADAGADQLTDAQLDRLVQMKDIVAVAVAIDPTSERLKTLSLSLAARVDEHAEKMTAAIDAATWPGHVSSFGGPGTTKGLSSYALEWFRHDRGWGGNAENPTQILDVAVRGPWQVAERDIFGRVVRWRLPILVAVTNGKLEPRNIARVYELSIVALEGAPGNAPKEPPFDGCWVGGNYMMRLDRFGGQG